MNCVVCYGPKDYRFEKREIPTPKKGEILVKVTCVGICAGDAKCFAGAPLFWGDENRKAYCEPPVIPGHEFIGEVYELGEDVTDFEIGEQIISEQIVPCNACRFCKRAQYHMCTVHDIYGFHQATFGAMAQYMIYPAKSLTHKVPKTLSPKQAVYIEPLACAIHCVERADIQFADVVVVSGCGPLGLGMIAAAKRKSPQLLIALDLLDFKLEIAKDCGADKVFNVGECDVVKEIQALTEGYGCDVYIEATGHPDSVKQGLRAISRLGRFIEFSVFQKETSVDWTIIGDTKELDIRGAHLSPNCYPTAIRMLEQKQVPVDKIVTHALPLKEFEKGIAMVNAGGKEDKSVKVVLMPWE